MTYCASHPRAAPPAGAVGRCTGNEKAAAGLHSSPPQSVDAGRSTGFILELPRPPSVNSIWKNLGNSSANVQRWVRACDRFVMAKRPPPRGIEGSFEIHIIWSKLATFDIDNPVKPLLDYLQRIELIDNDRNCQRLLVEFGHAPLGCIVRARPLVVV